MTHISLKIAESDADIKMAQELCRQWMEWHWTVFPEDGPKAGNPMEAVTFQGVIDNLAKIHARPTGAIILAEVDGQPAGCVMYHQMETDVTEIKRLFVNESGRGHGLGQLLLERMFEAMIADKYRTVRFSSARFLTHARRLYESVGFSDIPHPDSFPKDLREFAYFMERPLV